MNEKMIAEKLYKIEKSLEVDSVKRKIIKLLSNILFWIMLFTAGWNFGYQIGYDRGTRLSIFTLHKKLKQIIIEK